MDKESTHRLSHDEIIRECGDIKDSKAAAILALNATFEELVEAVAYVQGEDDVMGEERKQLTGNVAQIYDILTQDEMYEDDMDRVPRG